MSSFKVRDLVDILNKSGVRKFHMIHSIKEKDRIRIHIPLNTDIKALEENLYYGVPVGISFDLRMSARGYFDDQMIKRWCQTVKITTCRTFADWDVEEEARNGAG